MAKQTKTTKTTKSNKVGIIDLIDDVSSKLNDATTMVIYHNSRDKFDDVWLNRCYTVKAKIDLNKPTVSKGIFVQSGLTVDLCKLIKGANDVVVLLDAKGKVTYTKGIKDNQIASIDVAKHNDVANANKLAKQSNKGLLSGLSDDDLQKVKAFIDTL